MTQVWRGWYGSLGIAALAMGWATIASGGCANAQVIPDATLGGENSTVTSTGSVDQITGGATRGANLFHSFEQFGVDAGRGAYFTNPSGIENILSRVTGGSASNILGTLGVTGGNANLFLFNPNGIFFGPNASLDVGGAFVATTANTIQFGEQGFYSATTPDIPPLLTVNPSAILFNQITAQPVNSISNRGSLSVPNAQSLLLLGGNTSPNAFSTGGVLIDGGELLAPGGRVELGGAAGVGTVGLSGSGNSLSLSFPSELTRADVSLTNGAFVDVAAGGGGSIVVNARNLDIKGGSNLLAGIRPGSGSSEDAEPGNAGSVTINAQDAVTFAGANADGFRSAIFSDVGFNAIGNAGDISITTNTLSLADGATLSSGTFGTGDAGSVTIDARGNISLDGVGSAVASRVESSAVGNGGSIDITTGSLSVIKGAVISAGTFGRGNAGEVTINARNSISFDGVGSSRLPSAAASRVESSAVGNGGSIDITAESLFVTNGAVISAGTRGQGNAGTITINTRDAVALDGVNPRRSTTFGTAFGSGIFSTVEDVAVGNGGSIDIMAGLLIVTNGAQVSVSTTGLGNAGNLEVTAPSIALNSQAALTATSVLTDGGSISLQAGDLQLRHNSQISNIATGGGNGGSIDIDADTIVALENSDIVFEDLGGNVVINTQGLFFSPDSQVRTRTSSQQVSIPRDLQQPFVVTQPPSNFASPDQAVAGSCLARRNTEQGSFTVTGTGGLPRSPYEAISSHYSVTDVQPIQGSGPTSNHPAVVKTATWKRGDPIQEAQGLFVTADGRTIVGTAPQLATIAKAQDLVCSG